jgi:hypothetical protein
MRLLPNEHRIADGHDHTASESPLVEAVTSLVRIGLLPTTSAISKSFYKRSALSVPLWLKPTSLEVVDLMVAGSSPKDLEAALHEVDALNRELADQCRRS